MNNSTEKRNHMTTTANFMSGEKSARQRKRERADTRFRW